MKSLFKITLVIALLALIGPNSLFAEDAPSDFFLSVLIFSEGPYGSDYSLTIDYAGAVRYFENEFDLGTIDSAFAVLDSQQIQSIYDTILVVDFFDLDSLYFNDCYDGQSILVNFTADSISHTVEASNYAVFGINRIINALNTLLASEGIQLLYLDLEDTSPIKGGE